jgi:hypothetical protein
MIEDLEEKLRDQRILIIGSRFHDTQNEMLIIFKTVCPKSVWLDLRPRNTVFFKVLFRYFPFLSKYYLNDYYKREIKETFDQVLVVNPDCLYAINIECIRDIARPSRMILYMCDSFANRKRALKIINLFDKCLTYDSKDAKKYNLILRPLYFLSDIEKGKDKVNKAIDVLFVGTVHSDRLKFLSMIEKQCIELGLDYYFYPYLQNPIIFYFYKIFNRGFRGKAKTSFYYVSLSYDKYLMILETSKVVVDIQHPKNNGLTMRIFEALGKRKKIITTNATIKEYDFFNNKNIYIVDRNNPVINLAFFNTESVDIPDYLYYKYSFYGWLEDIFS